MTSSDRLTTADRPRPTSGVPLISLVLSGALPVGQVQATGPPGRPDARLPRAA
jgi:hypothetical protein